MGIGHTPTPLTENLYFFLWHMMQTAGSTLEFAVFSGRDDVVVARVTGTRPVLADARSASLGVLDCLPP
jgi:hypothetical protein